MNCWSRLFSSRGYGKLLPERHYFHSEHRQLLAENVVEFARQELPLMLLRFDEFGGQPLELLLIPEHGCLALFANDQFRCVHGVEIGQAQFVL